MEGYAASQALTSQLETKTGNNFKLVFFSELKKE